MSTKFCLIALFKSLCELANCLTLSGAAGCRRKAAGNYAVLRIWPDAAEYEMGNTQTTDRPQTSVIPHCVGHEPVCFVPGSRPVCALLEFVQAPTHILTGS